MDRKCTVCGQIKPISEFREDARTKDGYSRKCNACLGGSAEKIRGGAVGEHHLTTTNRGTTTPRVLRQVNLFEGDYSIDEIAATITVPKGVSATMAAREAYKMGRQDERRQSDNGPRGSVRR